MSVINLASEDATVTPPPMDKEVGFAFDWRDAMFLSWDGGAVFDYQEYESRDLNEMLKKDGKARTLENVLTLPIRQAKSGITPKKGDTGEAEWLNDFVNRSSNLGGMSTPLQLVISQATSAVTHKRAYFEKVFELDDDGRVVYKKLAYRPASTCRMLRDPKSGSFRGFEQDPLNIAILGSAQVKPVPIEAQRAFVYIHGIHRDPISGISDLEIAYWCYRTKVKLMFLWFQFLEGQSLPRTIVEASDLGKAQQVAQQVAKLKSSGVLPVSNTGGANSLNIHTVDASGKGAEQFKQALDYLDTMSSNSVLAGFTDLTSMAHGGRGSMALSKDQTDFFLQARQGVAAELATFIENYVLADLVRYNFGPQGVVPSFDFGPLAEQDKDQTLDLLKSVIVAPNLNIPDEFVKELALQVAGYLDLDPGEIAKAFESAQFQAQRQAARAGANPQGQQVAGLAGAAGAAERVVRTAQQRENVTPAGPAVTGGAQ